MAPDLGPPGSRDPLRAIYEREQRRPTRSRLFATAAAVLVLGAFSVIVYYAYHEGMRVGSAGVAPLIKAEPQPYKVKPEEPGGMEVPHQDKLIYNEVTRQGGEGSKQPVERLLPPPEQPMAKPIEETSARLQEAPAPAAPQTAAPAQSAAEPAAPPSGSGLATGTTGQPAAPQLAKPTPPAPAQSAAKPGNATPTQLAARPDGAGWRVQLGAMHTVEDARHEWERLQKKHRELLGALAMTLQRVDFGSGKGVFYRIQAGPVGDRDAANGLCDRLKAVQVGCLAVKP